MARIDKRSLGKLINDLINLENKVKITAKKVENDTKKEVKENLEHIGRTAIDMFYEEYSPHIYRRKYDLYNAYKVHVNNKVWEIVSDPKYMKHNHATSNEYIFWNSFENGFHGGAVNGPHHPEPGVPWWRLKGRWYQPASGGYFSPSEYIEREANTYLDSVPQQMQNEFESIIDPLMDNVVNQFYKTFRI